MGKGKRQKHRGTPEMMLRYEVPPWFLDRIQTADELKNVRAKLRLVDETPDDQQEPSAAVESPGGNPISELASDKQDTVFTVSQESVYELLDAAASLQTMDLAGRLSASHSSLEIPCEMRFGLQFLDELVIHMAQELDSSLT
ncbi:AAA family ATPase [Colletotrichum sojae]|uniref:AAA family ATPase n=1 Tax=Colletotrichum sojae TaxID=2175907 RepID=A0A8H6IQK2_9PEZI|nr:AAA family ATPase [Colletotrichum sojae]